MLFESSQGKLRRYGVSISSISELVSGVKLAELVDAIFYDGQNVDLQKKIIKVNESRKGNNVININNILKQIKSDENISCPPEIKSITSFSMIQDEEKMMMFLEWLLNEGEKRNISYQDCEKQSPHKYDEKVEVQDQFDNVYFGVELSPGKGEYNEEKSVCIEPEDKPVAKNSYKLIRPKEIFEDPNKNSATGLKEIKTIQNHEVNYKQASQEDLSPRKTVLKMIEKPPIYPSREKNKQQKKITNQAMSQMNFYSFEANTPFTSDQKTAYQSHQKTDRSKNPSMSEVKDFDSQKKKNSFLQHEISNLQQEIESEKIRMKTESRRHTISSSSKKKLFKVDISETKEQQKKEIVEWLISSGLLVMGATDHFSSLHQICKDGVIFPEIINRNKGRGSELGYFKNPKRSAEIHSNYQKVFTYLKDFPSFSNQLMFLYEYFVPQSQERAFWSFMKSLYKFYGKKVTNQSNKGMFTKEDEIKSRMIKRSQSANLVPRKRMNSEKKSIDHEGDIGYENIKFGTSSGFKERKKSQKNIVKNPIQFIKQMPDKMFQHGDLVQKQEPIELGALSNGYRQLYEMKKNYVNTPSKKVSQDTSLTKSRIISMNSKKKSSQRTSIPSVSLEMEMKALKFLKEKKYKNFFERQKKELFTDCLRNGVLLNQIIQGEFDSGHTFNKKPKSIENCRQNYLKGIRRMSRQIQEFPLSYQNYFQEIIKGQISLFYGLVWFIAQKKSEKFVFSRQNPVSSQSESIIMWIRALEQENPSITRLKIRDQHTLHSSILSSNLLYLIAPCILPNKYITKPTYQNPVSSIEQQANLKRIISFLIQNKAIKGDYIWRVRLIVKGDKDLLNALLKDLLGYYMSKKSNNEDSQHVTFVKYLRKTSNSPQYIEKLETTMAQPSLIQKEQKNLSRAVKNSIQVPWMQKLGFQGDISINNGVVLCHLMSQLTMQSIIGIKQNPQSNAQCLANIRKALKLVPKSKWDEHDILHADQSLTLDFYRFIREKFKHAYAMKSIA